MKMIKFSYFSHEYVMKTIMCLIGVFIIAFGVGIMRYADFGLDPFMCFANGVYITLAKPLRISFGLSFLLFSLFFLLFVFIFDRTKIGLGTLLTMMFCGYIADIVFDLCGLFLPIAAESSVFRFILMLIGILFEAIGSGIYFNTYIGVSPYDAVGLILSEKSGNQKLYRWIRIGTDIICVTTGFFMGSTIGAGTVIMALFTGPLFAFFRSFFLILGKRLKIIT